jgi:transposase InsO family protein
MGRVGSCYNNALMENFWSTLRIELVYRTAPTPASRWRTRSSPTSTPGHNTRRIQARLGDLSPDEYEAALYAANIEQPDPSGTTLEPTGAR